MNCMKINRLKTPPDKKQMLTKHERVKHYQKYKENKELWEVKNIE